MRGIEWRRERGRCGLLSCVFIVVRFHGLWVQSFWLFGYFTCGGTNLQREVNLNLDYGRWCVHSCPLLRHSLWLPCYHVIGGNVVWDGLRLCFRLAFISSVPNPYGFKSPPVHSLVTASRCIVLASMGPHDCGTRESPRTLACPHL